jgi:sn-glycerol 3-phosphate transport system permease protein
LLFLLFLAQLMITPQSTILPNYITVSSLRLLDTRLAVMIPYFASAFGTFLMRQAFLTIPADLEDAASIDGCNILQYLWHVALPIVRPALIAFSIISVTFHWNEFFWPLIVTETARARPLTVGLTIFAQQSEGGAEWHLLMAATMMVVAPLLLGFIVFQRQFVQSFMRSGLKG